MKCKICGCMGSEEQREAEAELLEERANRIKEDDALVEIAYRRHLEEENKRLGVKNE